MALRVEDGGKIIRGTAVPFNTPAIVLVRDDVVAEVMGPDSFARLPGEGVPLLQAHRRDLAPIGLARNWATRSYGLTVEAELVGSDSEIEGWRRRLSNGLSAGLSIGFTSDRRRTQWERPARRGDPPIMKPRGVQIVELSLTQFPAYSDAAIHSLSERTAADQRSHKESEQIIAEWNAEQITAAHRRQVQAHERWWDAVDPATNDA